jgi:hypothetical protein
LAKEHRSSAHNVRAVRVAFRVLARVARVLAGTFAACAAASITAAACAGSPALRTEHRLASIARNIALLVDFLTRMPKGGDLHHHLTGAVYAESYIDYAVADGDCIENPGHRRWVDPRCAARALQRRRNARRRGRGTAQSRRRGTNHARTARVRDRARRCGLRAHAALSESSAASARPIKEVFAQMLAGFELAQRDPRVVAVNLVQSQDEYRALHDFALHMRMLDYLHGVYPRVHISLHAGELTPGEVPPAELYGSHIRDSIELGHAERIGHGLDIAYERDAPALLAAE